VSSKIRIGRRRSRVHRPSSMCRTRTDGGWRFKPEKIKTGSRGRENGEPSNSANSALPHMEETSTSAPSTSKSTWLQTFHLILVLDLPDPSSSASGNLAKYFNILYEQIAFTVTAVLYQEQVLSNFVENECDTLIALKDNYFSKGLFPHFYLLKFIWMSCPIFQGNHFQDISTALSRFLVLLLL